MKTGRGTDRPHHAMPFVVFLTDQKPPPSDAPMSTAILRRNTACLRQDAPLAKRILPEAVQHLVNLVDAFYNRHAQGHGYRRHTPPLEMSKQV
jgi:hypothetical protein